MTRVIGEPPRTWFKDCQQCGRRLEWRAWETNTDYKVRVFCNQKCAGDARSTPLGDKLASGSKLMPSGCVEWQRNRDPKGYGRMAQAGTKEVLSHRLSWIDNRGPIPPGMQVLHHCDNPPCINPEHLYLGTNDDNMRDRIARERNHRPIGELNNKAKLTEADIARIRADRVHSHATLGRHYGVTYGTISAIRSGITWGHIQAEPPK